MAEKKLSFVCVACGYEEKASEERAGDVCPNCGQQVLNVKSKGLSKWASGVFKKAGKKK